MTGMRRAVVAALTALLGAGCSPSGARPAPPQVVIGVTTTATTPALGPTVLIERYPDPAPLVDLSRPARPEPQRAPSLVQPDGAPPAAPVVFRSKEPVPGGLFFVLVAGSDARPREDVRRTNADSVHVIAVNPSTGEGTIVGIPRDAWVNVPGRGQRKLATALQGGPELLARTVRDLTGLPMKYYVLTGFTGLTRIVDDLGGVNVYVDRRMNDPFSGARFERGWHHFTGSEALAFSRNRHDTAHGDFSRSENHGRLILAALAKLRAEVGDDVALRTWVDVLLKSVYLDMPVEEVRRMAIITARLDGSKVSNVVVPGRVGEAHGQKVIFLGEEAARVFNDVRPDAVLGVAGPATTTTTEAPPTTTTTPAPTSVPRVLDPSTSSTSSTSSSSTSSTISP